ncbi:hypothetical protein EDB83DRAFT_729263 [Lactarius deliciosus]|nr:hypothetical protein EDB83DRAFT_729263 [Lactarius deliciosus]
MFTHTHTIFCCQIYVVRKAPYIVPQESPFKPLQDSNEWEPGLSTVCKSNAVRLRLWARNWVFSVACLPSRSYCLALSPLISTPSFSFSSLAISFAITCPCHLSPTPTPSQDAPQPPVDRPRVLQRWDIKRQRLVSRHTVSVASPIACPFQNVKMSAHPLSLPFSHPQDTVRCRAERRTHCWRIFIVMRYRVSVSYVLVCPASTSFHLDN